MLPSIISTSCLVTASPIPVPWMSEASSPRRENGWNNWSCFSFGIPGPVSEMETRSFPAAARSPRAFDWVNTIIFVNYVHRITRL